MTHLKTDSLYNLEILRRTDTDCFSLTFMSAW